MDLITIGEGLLDALEQFDIDILPLGLYASDDLVEGKKQKPRYQELQKVIFPYLLSEGFSEGLYTTDYFASHSLFKTSEGDNLGLTVVKYSNIKVRKYGSGYHVDKQENREYRWKQADLSGHVSTLWKHPELFYTPIQGRILLFISFDKSQRIFEQELAELQQSLKWSQKKAQYCTRTWRDRAN